MLGPIHASSRPSMDTGQTLNVETVLSPMHGSLLEQSSGLGATALSVPVPVTLGAQETNKLSVLSETSTS